ncbi:MAG TPA: hypothetical protein PLZ83_05155 [Dermatophilaceae bacterium]|jgi:hypothetical protein|nr:hypothetical protein [Dermatophilaceae bacterium]HQH89734.1 hypothetical protein [Dermatophilaceae bacterium]HQK61606.1 hypothetical protein [Dermatophilaceae bacterium]
MATAAATLDPWGRRRLVRTLVTVATAAALLLGGLGYAVYSAVGSTTNRPGADDAAAVAQALPPGSVRRDAIAAAPMLAVPPEAGRSGTPSTRQIPTMTLPTVVRVGPAGVATGFPQTPEGAVAQLAAIETTVLQNMSIERAHQVHDGWATPGAGSAESWELTGNVAAFLSSGAGQYADTIRGAVVATPVAAQIKGVDGDEWVLACVLLDIKARLATQARIAYGHCERMQWTPQEGGRWLLGPGTEPARAPSTWPGTDLAVQAGWKTVTVDQ